MKVLWVHNYDIKIKGNNSWLNVGYQDIIKEVKIDLLDLGDLRSIKNVYYAYKKLKIMSNNYDVIHAQYGSICGLLVSLLPHKGKVISFKGSDWNGYPFKSRADQVHNMISKLASRVALYFANFSIVMSKKMHNSIPKYFKNKVFVIPDGIDLKMFYPMDKMFARAKIGFEGDKSFWISFATVHKNNVKQLDLAERIIKKISETQKDIKFNLIFGINHSEMIYHINASNLILLTSWSEGWPNIIKEGLACNVPFVSTDVSDLKEIADREETCYVVANDIQAIYDVIIKSINNRNVQVDLRKYILDMEINNISKKIIEVYKKL